MTVAATLATAPLIAFHFEALSTTTLVANVLALPAVAPAMWLGMVGAAAAPGARASRSSRSTPSTPCCSPTSPRSPPGARAPDWAELHVRLGAGGPGRLLRGLAAILAALVDIRRAARPTACAWASARTRRASGAALSGPGGAGWRPRAARGRRGGARGRARQPPGLRVDGPRRRPGRRDPAAAGRRAGGAGRRRAAGRRPGGEARATRGSTASAPRSSPTTSPTTPAASRSCSAPCRSAASSTRGLGRRSLAAARAAGAATGRSRRERELRSGRLRLEVLWPPPELLAEPQPGADPNRLALVLLARWRGFSMLLTADAEAEAVPLDPGPVDVLKVAHHGSEDAGLGGPARPRPAAPGGDLGRRRTTPSGTRPRRPWRRSPPTASAILRTDRDGTVVIEVGGHGRGHGRQLTDR